MFNFLGALIYLVVAALALHAGARSHAAARAVPPWREPKLHWRLVALVFVLLAVWRSGHGEEWAQQLGRSAAYAAQEYQRRRELQGPLIVLALLMGAALLAWLALFGNDRPTIQWSRIASLCLLVYTAIRAISLHAVDTLIYRAAGPLHINHVIDLGLAALTGLLAAMDARRSRVPAPRQTSRR